ncbi:lymphocyte antigen 6 complex locus protein G6d-like [Spea bombifrons]|uniref:lymphocyte antigen 6 complex locus protein G6d-like n=1 Tax=Spea bombifrons TaxID=233779 RepID=UPI00234BE5B2|nr:lymphocyte antigen 6 complex locus protein G6d-like [Spea bombifrons]
MNDRALGAVFLFLLVSCQIGHTLDCYSCDYGTCLIPIKTSCGTLEVCVTETAKVAGFINFKRKGCMNPLSCLTDSSVTFAGATLTTSPSCCFSNLCNSAVASSASVISVIAATTVLWVARLF